MGRVRDRTPVNLTYGSTWRQVLGLAGARQETLYENLAPKNCMFANGVEPE